MMATNLLCALESMLGSELEAIEESIRDIECDQELQDLIQCRISVLKCRGDALRKMVDSGITTENKMYQEIQLPTCKAPTEVIESFLAYHEAYHYAIDRLEPDESLRVIVAVDFSSFCFDTLGLESIGKKLAKSALQAAMLKMASGQSDSVNRNASSLAILQILRDQVAQWESIDDEGKSGDYIAIENNAWKQLSSMALEATMIDPLAGSTLETVSRALDARESVWDEVSSRRSLSSDFPPDLRTIGTSHRKWSNWSDQLEGSDHGETTTETIKNEADGDTLAVWVRGLLETIERVRVNDLGNGARLLPALHQIFHHYSQWRGVTAGTTTDGVHIQFGSERMEMKHFLGRAQQAHTHGILRSEFVRFARNFRIIPLLISSEVVQMVFDLTAVNCNETNIADNSSTKEDLVLTFPFFVDCLCQCAIVAYSHASNGQKQLHTARDMVTELLENHMGLLKPHVWEKRMSQNTGKIVSSTPKSQRPSSAPRATRPNSASSISEGKNRQRQHTRSSDAVGSASLPKMTNRPPSDHSTPRKLQRSKHSSSSPQLPSRLSK